MAVPTVVGSVSGKGTSTVLSIPAGSDGDLLVLIGRRRQSFSSSDPAGWTALTAKTTTSSTMDVWYKVADSGDTSVTLSGSGNNVAILYRISGWGVVPEWAWNTLAQSDNPPLLNPSWAGAHDTLWIGAVSASRADGDYANPSSTYSNFHEEYSTLGSGSGSTDVSIAAGTLGTLGQDYSNPPQIPLTGTLDKGISLTLAIPAASGAGGTATPSEETPSVRVSGGYGSALALTSWTIPYAHGIPGFPETILAVVATSSAFTVASGGLTSIYDTGILDVLVGPGTGDEVSGILVTSGATGQFTGTVAAIVGDVTNVVIEASTAGTTLTPPEITTTGSYLWIAGLATGRTDQGNVTPPTGYTMFQEQLTSTPTSDTNHKAVYLAYKVTPYATVETPGAWSHDAGDVSGHIAFMLGFESPAIVGGDHNPVIGLGQPVFSG